MADRELMQQALDALEEIHPDNMTTIAEKSWSKAIEALRAVLAQPEPYAAQAAMVAQQTQGRMYVDPVTGDVGIGTVKPEPEVDVCCQEFDKCLRSCTPRGQWIAHVRCGCGDQIMPDDGAECGTCVTARNAVKQEPLAQMKEMLEVQGRDGTWNYDPYLQGMFNGMEFMVALAECRDPVFREAPERWLHTPPQREFIGLTEEEIKQLWKDTPQLVGVYSYTDIAREVEAKLKEKNT